MITFFLKKLRKIIKSIGKLETTIIDKLILINNKKRNNTKVLLKDGQFERFDNDLNLNKNLPKKLIIVICFYYNSKKIKNLKKTLLNLSLLKFKKEVIILTNSLNIKQVKSLKKLQKIIKIKFVLNQISNLPENNLLPWYSLNIMKEKYKNHNNTHFMLIEDDISINIQNIKYWIFFRKILKNFDLIPGFIRTEKYKKQTFSVDNPKKIYLNKLPKILTKSKNNGFVNSKYPYQAMYLMDRELMKEFILSDAVNVDFSFTNKFMKSVYPIKELSNISYAYINIPNGFHNRLVAPFNKNKKIPQYCLIEHNDIKYVKLKHFNKIGYGTIDINKLLV